MTSPPGPPPPSYGGPTYGAPPPPVAKRRRPSGWWFLAPVLLMVVGLALVVTGFVSTLGPLTELDDVVPADGQAQVVELDEPGPRLLMAPEGQTAPDCEVRGAGGEPLSVNGPGASYTYGDSSGSWRGFGVVEESGDELELTCSAEDAGSQVRVIPNPGGPGALFGGLATAFTGMGLGGLGFVGLVLLIVLYATGAPRRRTRDGEPRTDRSASGSDG